MTMTIDEIEALEQAAALHDGKCPSCHQTIKIYRYGLNKTIASFMRAMADAARDTGVNDIDVSTISLSYSVRTQITKLRLHGLVARVKNEAGVQIPNRWLITNKGWDFVNGKPIPSKVVVYNNQVLGHDDGQITIHQIMGELTPARADQYDELPVSPAEARTYENVREPQKTMQLEASYRGDKSNVHFRTGVIYDLVIERLEVGKPVTIVEPRKLVYSDIAAFQRDWKVVS